MKAMSFEERARIKISSIAIKDCERPYACCEWMLNCTADEIDSIYRGTLHTDDWPLLKRKYRYGKPKNAPSAVA
jgi:hypothetical protein